MASKALTTRTAAAKLIKANEDAEENPLMLVPDKAAAAVNFFLACNAHLARPGFQLAVAFRVRYWIESQNLTVEGLKAVFRDVCRPARQARQQHLGQVMADLADAVDAQLRKERSKREIEAHLSREKAAERTKVSAEEIHGGIVDHLTQYEPDLARKLAERWAKDHEEA